VCACLRLRKASRRVTQVYDEHLAASGLTVTQYSLLGHIRALEGISLGSLAETLVMDPTSLNRTLKPLARDGLVAVSVAKADARVRTLHMTPAGAQAYAAARPAWERAQAAVTEALGAARLAALGETIDHLLRGLARKA
jgi:DNA-binding MarR family transcriptional regulator